MKRILLFIYLFISFIKITNFGFCQQVEFQQDQYVNIEKCMKVYQTNKEKLFFTTLSSLSNCNYKIEEIQSKSGYILFSIYGKKFLATIEQIESKLSIIKITSADNSYIFSYSILDRLFSQISEQL